MALVRWIGLIVPLASVTSLCAAEAPPATDEWVDKDTGHRIVRLSRREGSNSVFYFHQNLFTAPGDKMVFVGTTPQGPRAFTVDLRTREIRQITTQPVGGHAVVAPKRRELIYMRAADVFATHLDTGETRKIADVPAHYPHGRGLSVSADETLLAGCYAKGEEEYYRKYPYKVFIRKIFEAGLPNALYTISIKTGRVNEVHTINTWLGHVQFSPTDPTLIMFCHEGPERELDRIWTIRSDGTGLRKMRERMIRDVMVTHEFWQPDGKKIWFDLQIPRYQGDDPTQRALAWARGPHYYLASIDVDSGTEARYGLLTQESSWHYNVSPDGKLFCGGGDGRDPLRGGVGKWLYLFEPQGDRMKATRLCNLAAHDYSIAPMVRFTPDNKWVVFQAKLKGSMQVYAVEVERRGGR
ncbi:MAG: hypothetical protein JXQ73_31240 [Phycisphaerae bacterium]|nr:hypothetical protein [Phycisphaerae bacterium]